MSLGFWGVANNLKNIFPLFQFRNSSNRLCIPRLSLDFYLGFLNSQNIYWLFLPISNNRDWTVYYCLEWFHWALFIMAVPSNNNTLDTQETFLSPIHDPPLRLPFWLLGNHDMWSWTLMVDPGPRVNSIPDLVLPCCLVGQGLWSPSLWPRSGERWWYLRPKMLMYLTRAFPFAPALSG